MRVLGNDADGEEVFAVVSENLWRSLRTFEWRCSLRTWVHVIARHEIERFRRSARRHAEGRVPISQLAEVIAAVQTESRSVQGSARQSVISRLRDELPEDDRALLVLRVDRELPWDEIALAFVEDPERCTHAAGRREAARLRKRFPNLTKRMAERARDAGLLKGPSSK